MALIKLLTLWNTLKEKALKFNNTELSERKFEEWKFPKASP